MILGFISAGLKGCGRNDTQRGNERESWRQTEAAWQMAELPFPFHAVWCSSVLFSSIPHFQDPGWVNEAKRFITQDETERWSERRTTTSGGSIFWQRWQRWEKALFWHTCLSMKRRPVWFQELPVFPNAFTDGPLVFDSRTHTGIHTCTWVHLLLTQTALLKNK